MAKEDIQQYSLDEIMAMRERGDYTPTPADAPSFAVDDAFWETARLVEPKTKETISMRVDPDVLDWFKSQGKGHLTRMHTVLRSYVEAHKHTPPPATRHKPD